MPSKPRDPTRPTFYLDHSTLVDAFRAHELGNTKSDATLDRPLLQWIERVANEANLCLSTFHLAELGRWEGDGARVADGMAAWYEGLPIVWVRGLTSLLEAEEEYWTKVAAGVAPAEEVQAFVSSLLLAFDALEDRALGQLLASRAPLSQLVTSSREVAGRHLAFMHRAAETFHAEQAWVREQGWTDAEKSARLGLNQRTAIRRAAQEADARLRGRGDVEYESRRCSSGDVQDRLVDLFASDARALPTTRAMHAFATGFVPSIAKKVSGSEKERQALSGSFHDLVHLAVGAAYCDVFTCDAIVDRFLGGLRATLGKFPQLSVGRHPAGRDGFVKELMSRWP